MKRPSRLTRALLSAGVLALALAAACSSGSSSSTTTTTTATRATTTTTPPASSSASSASSSSAAGGSVLKTPDRIGSYVKLNANGAADQLKAGLNQPDIQDSVLAFYGPDENSPAFVLVAVQVNAASQASAQQVLDAIVEGISGQAQVDKSQLVDKSKDGIPYRCGLVKGQDASSQGGAFCSWSDGNVLGVGISVPPNGPGDIDGAFGLTSQAAVAVKA